MVDVRKYPPKDIDTPTLGAVILSVSEESPADDAGIYPGCTILSVNGKPLRDALDWQWVSAEDEITLDVEEPNGDVTCVELAREPFETWGIEFRDTLFDGVKMCKNDCAFCFMKQLPRGLRKSLYMRDDDYRLSFTQGTFVTLTNLDESDIARIIEQHISPLRMSLHAVDEKVREDLIGKHAARGLDNLCKLLSAGIEFDTQIVLVPGINDGSVLNETIQWAYEHPGIKTLGIVPLGYTDHQSRFKGSFDRDGALALLDAIQPFQEQALCKRGYPWVYASDEFYTLAFGDDVLKHLPDATFYDDFAMFEDGIGIIRANVDEFETVRASGLLDETARALVSSCARAFMISGEAMRPYFAQLIENSSLRNVFFPLFVKNNFFGGNVDVTGLLSGADIIEAIKGVAQKDTACEGTRLIFLIPDVIFNSDGLTLDGLNLDDIADKTCQCVCSISSNPLDYMKQIADKAKEI